MRKPAAISELNELSERELNKLIRYSREYRPLLAYDEDLPDWTQAHAREFANFLTGELGATLLIRLRAQERALIDSQIAKADGGSIDFCRGARLMLQNLIMLSMQDKQEEEQDSLFANFKQEVGSEQDDFHRRATL